MKIIVCGDVHGCWSHLTRLIETEKPDVILQCGDFGYWPDSIGRLHIKSETQIYWCDGNHEHFLILKETPNLIPNVTYMPRGSILTLDNKRILFFGGATSIDKNRRTPGYDWFPDEVPSQSDFDKISTVEPPIDIMISHTCPLEFTEIDTAFYLKKGKISDSTRIGLSEVLSKFSPSQWYFGHWHRYMKGGYKNTKWTLLNMAGEKNWWTILE